MRVCGQLPPTSVEEKLGPKGWKKYRPRPEEISLHSGLISVQDGVTDELFKRAKEIGRILKNQLGALLKILSVTGRLI